jgi:hypothetical protein
MISLPTRLAGNVGKFHSEHLIGANVGLAMEDQRARMMAVSFSELRRLPSFKLSVGLGPLIAYNK